MGLNLGRLFPFLAVLSIAACVAELPSETSEQKTSENGGSASELGFEAYRGCYQDVRGDYDWAGLRNGDCGWYTSCQDEIRTHVRYVTAERTCYKEARGTRSRDHAPVALDDCTSCPSVVPNTPEFAPHVLDSADGSRVAGFPFCISVDTDYALSVRFVGGENAHCELMVERDGDRRVVDDRYPCESPCEMPTGTSAADYFQ